MTKRVRFAREAREELLAAGRWYEQQRPGLRASFLDAVDEALERLLEYQGRAGRVPGVNPSLPVRRVFVRRFPYTLVFIELSTHVRILAVAHEKRRPAYWRERLEE